MTEILVLRQKIHGLRAASYADVLRDRLPDCTVVAADTPATEREALETADVATGFALGPDELNRADELELFACVFAGTGHLDLDAFAEHDVAVTNASGVHRPNISEYVVGSMIAFARRFAQAQAQQRRSAQRGQALRQTFSNLPFLLDQADFGSGTGGGGTGGGDTGTVVPTQRGRFA